jgi:hypothetical protein
MLPAGRIFEVADLKRFSSHVFAVAAMTVFVLGIWLMPAGGPSGDGGFVAEFNRLYGYVSSDDQRRAHMLAILALVLCSAASFVIGTQRDFGTAVRPFAPVGAGVSVIAAVIVLVSYRQLVPSYIVSGATVFCALFLLTVLYAPYLRSMHLERLAVGIIGAYFVILVVPGLVAKPIAFLVSDADSISQLETHLQWLPLRGSAIAAGQKFFQEIPIGYGLLMPSIMSIADLRTGGLSAEGLLRFVQASQVLFCGAAVAAYVAYRPRNYLGVLTALLLAGPYWASAGLGIWHANQTGFRSLGLPVGMLAMVLASRLAPVNAAWVLGAVAGIAAVMNFETAVAVVGGYVVFLIARTRSIPVGLIARSVLAGLLAVAAYLVVYRLALGRNAFSLQALDVFELLGRFSSGIFGLRLFSSGDQGDNYYVVPFALFMFGHAMYVVIDGFRRLGSGPLPARGAVRMGVAVSLIAWLAYYFSGPNWWQIWTHLFLYGFLLIDLVDRRRFGIRAVPAAASLKMRWSRMRIQPGLLTLMLLLALMIPHTNRHLFVYGSDFMYPAWIRAGHEAAVLSGVLMPKDKAASLQAKADKLKELHAAAKGNLVYLTFNSAFMPHLTRIFQPAPYRDMLGEIRGEQDFGRRMAELLARRPEFILIDAPDGALAVGGVRKDYQDRIRAAVGAGYGLAETTNGWQVWRPRTLAPG